MRLRIDARVIRRGEGLGDGPLEHGREDALRSVNKHRVNHLAVLLMRQEGLARGECVRHLEYKLCAINERPAGIEAQTLCLGLLWETHEREAACC